MCVVNCVTVRAAEPWLWLACCNLQVNITRHHPTDTGTQLGGRHHPSKFSAARVWQKVRLIPTAWKNYSDKIKNNRRKWSGTSSWLRFGFCSQMPPAPRNEHVHADSSLYSLSACPEEMEVPRGPSACSPGPRLCCLSGGLGSRRVVPRVLAGTPGAQPGVRSLPARRWVAAAAQASALPSSACQLPSRSRLLTRRAWRREQ